MAKVVYVGLPAAIKREIAGIVKEYQHTLPGWLEKLIIQYNHDHTGELSDKAIAQIEVRYEYRYAVMTVFGYRWDDPLVDRERVIVHEMAHCHITPIDSLCKNLLERHSEIAQTNGSNPALDALHEAHRVAMESATEDVAQALIRAHRGA
jgi:hypothetical protein